MTELPDLPVAALAEAFATGAASPVEAARAVLERIDAWEPTLRAVTHHDDAAALRAAVEAEARWRADEPRGELDGVPVTIKENVATRGVPMVLGSAAIPPEPAATDAPAAARLREAGAVLVAKTTMPDFGMLTSGVSSAHPTTRQAWNPAWNPGGSSAGAGAAAVAGYAAVHVGTDIGGSGRLPGARGGGGGVKGLVGGGAGRPPGGGGGVGGVRGVCGGGAVPPAVLRARDRAADADRRRRSAGDGGP